LHNIKIDIKKNKKKHKTEKRNKKLFLFFLATANEQYKRFPASGEEGCFLVSRNVRRYK